MGCGTLKRNTKAAVAVVAAAAILVVGGASGAVAGKLITGNQIAKDTITSKNLAPKSVGKSELAPSALKGFKDGVDGAQGPAGAVGAQGPKGAAGAQGAQGLQGAPGAPGAPGADAVLDTYDEVTEPNADPNWHGAPVVLVTPSPVNGTADVPQDILTFHLDKGEYRLDLAAQFVHFVPGADGEDFGVVTVTVDGEPLGGQMWTSDIPSSNNVAQTFGWQHVEVGADGADLAVKATVRGVRHAEAGAYVTVSKLG